MRIKIYLFNGLHIGFDFFASFATLRESLLTLTFLCILCLSGYAILLLVKSR